MFNEDYTQMAGRFAGPGGVGERAVAFEVRTGLPMGPEPDAGNPADAPRDSYPVFHEGDLWYIDRTGRLRSRLPENPPESARDRGPAVDALWRAAQRGLLRRRRGLAGEGLRPERVRHSPHRRLHRRTQRRLEPTPTP